MKEIVIISGKGGTGKTSISASFAALSSENAVFTDCDVDASDLHLILCPEETESFDLYSGRKAQIIQDKCVSCGACLANCRFEAVKMKSSRAGNSLFTIDEFSCEGCGVCVRFCPLRAIDFPEKKCGVLHVSKTRFGTMVHSALEAGSGNSGKLVSKVRTRARELAENSGKDLILIDGPPGIGCPVIASITGTSLAVIVTEPTLSGVNDMKRTLKLVEHFGIPVFVCVNKYDINMEETHKLINQLRNSQIVKYSHLVPYDPKVTESQVEGKAIVEITKNGAAEAISNLWKIICDYIEIQNPD